MKYNLIFISLFVAIGSIFVSCSSDDPSSTSIFSVDEAKMDSFERWIQDNYTLPYNVELQYKLDDIETDKKYNLIPADSAKSAQLAIITKYMWFDAYSEVAGQEFVKQNTPRILMFVGNPAYNSNGTTTLATAEGGYKVTLYLVNSLTENTIRNYAWLNYYFFHTMHHEFTHILNQKKPYDVAFDLVTPRTYVSGDWYQYKDEDCLKEGFISNYARSEAREDFAELVSFYITDSSDEWNAKLRVAGTNGANLINQKMNIIKDYMIKEWNIDLDLLKASIQRRAKTINSVDLTRFN